LGSMVKGRRAQRVEEAAAPPAVETYEHV
jgi:hypothetical protein